MSVRSFVLLLSLLECLVMEAQTLANFPVSLSPQPSAPARTANVYLSEFGLFEGFVDTMENEGFPVVVKRNSPAEHAGVLNDDFLVNIAGKSVHTVQDAKHILSGISPGNPVPFQFRRGDETYQVFLERAVYSAREQPIPTRIYDLRFAQCHGLELRNYEQSENGGVLVCRVFEHLAGAEAGLEPGDIIVAADGQPVTLWSELHGILERFPFKKQLITLTIWRSGAEMQLHFKNEYCPPPGVKVLPSGPAYLGIYQSIDWRPGQAIEEGIVIGKIAPFSSADRAGLKTGDLLVEIDGKPITGTVEFAQALTNLDKRASVDFLIVRGTGSMHLSLIPPRLPAEANTATEKPSDISAPTEREQHIGEEEATLQPRVFRIFPNPNSGLFTLEFSAGAGPVRVQVRDLTGALLFSENIDDFSGEYARQFDFRGIPPQCIAIQIEQRGLVFSKIVAIQ